MPDASRRPELVSGSIFSLASRSPEWMLKQVQHDERMETLSYSAGAVQWSDMISISHDLTGASRSEGDESGKGDTRPANPRGTVKRVNLPSVEIL